MFLNALIADESGFVESLGAFLKHTRLQKGLTIEKVSQATKIRPFFLTCLENEDFEALPGTVYTTGFIRNYCDYLAVPSDSFVSLYLTRISTMDKQSSFKIYLPTKPQKILTLTTFLISFFITVFVSVFWYIYEKKYVEQNVVGILLNTADTVSPKRVNDISEKQSILTDDKCDQQRADLSPKQEISDVKIVDKQASGTQPTDEQPVAVLKKIAESHLEILDETWIKITDDKGERIKAQYLKKGDMFDLTPYHDAYISVGDAEKVVHVQHHMKTQGPVYFGVPHGFVDSQKIKQIPIVEDDHTKQEPSATSDESIFDDIGE